MDTIEKDTQSTRECLVHYLVLFAVFNGPGQHLTIMAPHEGRLIRK